VKADGQLSIVSILLHRDSISYIASNRSVSVEKSRQQNKGSPTWYLE